MHLVGYFHNLTNTFTYWVLTTKDRF